MFLVIFCFSKMLLFCFRFISCSSHSYSKGDGVPLLAAQIAPMYNPWESFPMYKIPYCTLNKKNKTKRSLTDMIQGDYLVPFGIDLKYQQKEENRFFCSTILKGKEYNRVGNYSQKGLYTKFYIDDIPVYGHFSTIRNGIFRIFTHFVFTIYTNGSNIIDAELYMQDPVDIAIDSTVSYRYSVFWNETTITDDKKFDKYKEEDFFQSGYRVLSLISHGIILILLFGIVYIIVTRFAAHRPKGDTVLDNSEIDLQLELGWRLLHGEVFRPATFTKTIVCLASSGIQITFCCLVMSILNQIYPFYRKRTGFVNSFILSLAVSTPLAGFFSSIFAKMNGISNPIQTAVLGSLITPTLFTSYLVANSLISIVFRTNRILSIGNIVVIILIFILIIIPLVVLGNMFSRKSKLFSHKQSDISAVARTIPNYSLFIVKLLKFLLAGFVVAAPTFSEFYYLLATFSHLKITITWIYSIISIVFLIFSAGFVSIIVVYNFLQNEDYRWQWISFTAPATSSVFVLLYCLKYFMNNLELYGLCQTMIIIVFLVLVSITMALFTGGSGYLFSCIFIHHLYRNLKID